MIKALHQHVTPYEKVVQHICYVAAQNRLDIIQSGNYQRQTTALYDMTLRYQNSVQARVALVLFPVLYCRLHATEQAASADFALLL